MAKTILVTAPRLEPAGLTLVEDAGCRIDFVPPETPRATMERMPATTAYDRVLSRFVPISGAAMASCPSLRVISRAAPRRRAALWCCGRPGRTRNRWRNSPSA